MVLVDDSSSARDVLPAGRDTDEGGRKVNYKFEDEELVDKLRNVMGTERKVEAGHFNGFPA